MSIPVTCVIKKGETVIVRVPETLGYDDTLVTRQNSAGRAVFGWKYMSDKYGARLKDTPAYTDDWDRVEVLDTVFTRSQLTGGKT